MPNTYQYYNQGGQLQQIQANTPEEALSNAPGIASDSGVQLISGGIQPTTPPTGTGPTAPPPPATDLPTNPVISGSSVSAANAATGADITALTNASNLNSSLYQNQMDALEQRRQQEIDQIRREYEQAIAAQSERQSKDYAGRATGLVTSGGGFLGATQSQQGVLQNLRQTHEAEKGALMSKRDAAIREAQSAYDDKQFDLARMKANEAKELEKEIYNRQKQFADDQLAIAREGRAQTEFDIGMNEKKIEAYSMMDDTTFNQLTPEQLAQTDKMYYSGYTKQARTIAKKALDVKTNKEAVALDADILDMRLKIPAGQKFTLNGQTYTGLKQKETSGGGGTEGERAMALRQKVATLFSPGYTVPGTDGLAIIDNNGYATPEGWKAVAKISGMNRQDFIKDFGYLIPVDLIDKYGLTVPEQELILGK